MGVADRGHWWAPEIWNLLKSLVPFYWLNAISKSSFTQKMMVNPPPLIRTGFRVSAFTLVIALYRDTALYGDTISLCSALFSVFFVLFGDKMSLYSALSLFSVFFVLFGDKMSLYSALSLFSVFFVLFGDKMSLYSALSLFSVFFVLFGDKMLIICNCMFRTYFGWRWTIQRHVLINQLLTISVDRIASRTSEHHYTLCGPTQREISNRITFGELWRYHVTPRITCRHIGHTITRTCITALD